MIPYHARLDVLDPLPTVLRKVRPPLEEVQPTREEQFEQGDHTQYPLWDSIDEASVLAFGSLTGTHTLTCDIGYAKKVIYCADFLEALTVAVGECEAKQSGPMEISCGGIVLWNVLVNHGPGAISIAAVCAELKNILADEVKREARAAKARDESRVALRDDYK